LGTQAYKVSYLVPGVGFNPEELERRRRILQSYASDGVTIQVTTVKEGPTSVESFYDAAFAGPPMLRAVTDIEAEGCKAIIIGGYFDPFIEAAREVALIPIVGPGETSILFASTVCRKFSIVTMLPRAIPILQKQVKALGFESKIASLRAIQIPVLEVNRNAEKTKEALLEEYRRARDEDGAEAVIPGNMSLSFLQAHGELENRLGIPVLDPASLAVKMAETMVGLSLSHSKVAYPKPRNAY
jgi:allantoin racemase